MKLSIQFKSLLKLLGLAIFIGAFGCFAAVLFQGIVIFFHNLFFLHQVSFSFQETLHTLPIKSGIWVIFVPVLGSFLVTWILKTWAAGETGLGIPEIFYSFHHQTSKINSKRAVTKAFAAAISIGTGGSVGREGPTVQLGAALGSVLSDWINLSPQLKNIIVAAGVAAVTAAMFNAPIASILFVIELFLISINLSSILLIILSAATAVFVKYIFFSYSPIFSFTNIILNRNELFTDVGLCIVLGIIIGLLSILFIRGLYWTQDLFEYLFKNLYLRHAIGMFFVGLMMYLLMQTYHYYYIDEIGFVTVQETLLFLINNYWLLLLLFIYKLFATCLTLGTGARGGVFSPALFLGATLGGAFGAIVNSLFPDIVIHPVIFVVAGMAGMLGSVTGAFLTAIVLTIELTNDYHAIVFIVTTTLIAYIVRKVLCKESIYTLKLARRGIVIKENYRFLR